MRTIKTRHFTGTTDNTVTKRELENAKLPESRKRGNGTFEK